MTTYYQFFNTTKKEYITFLHLPVATRQEIIDYPISTALITYYILHNCGDVIIALSEYDNFPADFDQYREVTDVTIDVMIKNGFLIEQGREYLVEDKTSYLRKLDLTQIEWKNKQ